MGSRCIKPLQDREAEIKKKRHQEEVAKLEETIEFSVPPLVNASTTDPTEPVGINRNETSLEQQTPLAETTRLEPKGLSDNSISREISSQSVSGRWLSDDIRDKVPVSSKPMYQRLKHDWLLCIECDHHPEGFRGPHELSRHKDRDHATRVKKWMGIEPEGQHLKPVVPLTRCKACSQQQKKYFAYYNAAAHLRRTHFRPKAKGRVELAKRHTSGGDWPPTSELKYWLKEVEELAEESPSDRGDSEELDNSGVLGSPMYNTGSEQPPVDTGIFKVGDGYNLASETNPRLFEENDTTIRFPWEMPIAEDLGTLDSELQFVLGDYDSQRM